MSEDDVWLAVPNYGNSTKILAPVDLLPFGDGETVTLGIKGSEASAKPLSTALMKRFAARYPVMKFVSPSPVQHSFGSYTNFGVVRFQNRFSARCDVTYSCALHGINYVSAQLYLTRSPVNLGDNEWHVTQVENLSSLRFIF